MAVSDEDAAALGSSVADWPAFPDSADALARLKRHYRLVILSNIDRAGFAASNRRLGVEFDTVLTAQDIGSYKPNPANFDALLAKIDGFGIPRRRLLHVAQSLFHDHVPAKAKGLPTVWINRRQDQQGWGATPPPAAGVQPDAEFPSIARLRRRCRRRVRHRRPLRLPGLLLPSTFPACPTARSDTPGCRFRASASAP